ncbi:protein kinase [Streptomyces sp. NBC_01356]|uniref:protein kinase domain-containing protein n=1 Tax=Streptomyces sp. NBC_01356 TaxID=2903836 RepID=UPI002E2F8D76|nr:protein kinase [Streptomyces sp. NBC_01356]
MTNGMLPTGTTLTDEDGAGVMIVGLLGSGGQGEVYRVRTPAGERALKWYYPGCATDQQLQIVEDLVGRGFTDERFLWPQQVVSDNAGGFGYLMDLRPDRFRGLPELFRRQVSVHYQELVTAGIHMVEAYKALHSRGVAYRDISWGNIFFDPATGDVLVCDNDNAVVEGAVSGIAGTMEFMAPELVRGDDGATPSTQTDLHSLAVLLFMLLMNHHPLKGVAELRIRCLDEAAEKKLYGTNPVFVFDPADQSNRPDAHEQTTVLATWGAAPPALQDLFVHSFTEGLREPSRRVRESQWRETLSKIRDTIVICSDCGRQNMTEPDSQTGPSCWSCGKTLVMPAWLVVTTAHPRTVRTVRLGRDARLYGHHLEAEPKRHDYSRAAVIAELSENPKRPGQFGLTNRSQETWHARRTDGTAHEVEPGRSVSLRPGLGVNLGSGAEAVVHSS